MRFTNKLNFPAAIAEAVKNDPYTRGDADISVTQLIRPPQQVTLQKHCAGEMVEDISDRIYALMGQAMHVVLERSNITGIAEKRVFAECNKWIVSGAFDSIALTEVETDTGNPEWVLQDYKQMSIYEVIYGIKPDRTEQLNLLDWLLKSNMKKNKTYPPITRLEIVGIFRDWSKPEAGRRKAAKDETYPQHQVGIFPIDRWTDAKQIEFAEKRVRIHQDADQLRNDGKIGSLPECTPEERWASETTYALLKEGRQKAMKVESSEEKLMAWAVNKGHSEDNLGPLNKGFSIETRPGINRRCQDYCDVSQFCNQWARINSSEAVK